MERSCMRVFIRRYVETNNLWEVVCRYSCRLLFSFSLVHLVHTFLFHYFLLLVIFRDYVLFFFYFIFYFLLGRRELQLHTTLYFCIPYSLVFLFFFSVYFALILIFYFGGAGFSAIQKASAKERCPARGARPGAYGEGQQGTTRNAETGIIDAFKFPLNLFYARQALKSLIQSSYALDSQSWNALNCASLSLFNAKACGLFSSRIVIRSLNA